MNKGNNIIQFLITISIILIVGVLSSLVYTKIDLTKEKRHTLTSSTIEMMENLENDVFVRVYLHGDFPAQFQRLEKAINERLDELVDYSDGKLSFEFVDPYEGLDKTEQKNMETTLYKEGLEFTRLNYSEDGVNKYRIIWPGAIINYNGLSAPVQFFKSNNSTPTENMINSSVNNLEFEFSSVLRGMQRKEKPAIAIIDGHGELSPAEFVDFTMSLQESYLTERVILDGRIDALSDQFEGMTERVNKYDAIVIAKPLLLFSFQDKVIIDQYIMNGGKVLWMVDPLLTDLDSLRNNQSTMAITNEIGIYDMLFDYGVRLNRDMVLDYDCSKIGFDIGPRGNQRQMKLFNWYYSPILKARENPHPIASNLDPIIMEFASSIDTVGENSSITKTVILESSKNAKAFKAPVRINTGIVDLDLAYFQNNPQPNKTLGILLEGVFNSGFKHRIPDTLKNDPNFSFVDQSKQTKMIVISDGDIGRNKTRKTEDGLTPMPLGYDNYARSIIYDNREFLLNCINYLLDDQALISIRSRTISVRKLSTEKTKTERLKWQLINIIFPLFIITILGLIISKIRKNKYTN